MSGHCCCHGERCPHHRPSRWCSITRPPVSNSTARIATCPARPATSMRCSRERRVNVTPVTHAVRATTRCQNPPAIRSAAIAARLATTPQPICPWCISITPKRAAVARAATTMCRRSASRPRIFRQRPVAKRVTQPQRGDRPLSITPELLTIASVATMAAAPRARISRTLRLPTAASLAIRSIRGSRGHA